jgi:hypothetical protein
MAPQPVGPHVSLLHHLMFKWYWGQPRDAWELQFVSTNTLTLQQIASIKDAYEVDSKDVKSVAAKNLPVYNAFSWFSDRETQTSAHEKLARNGWSREFYTPMWDLGATLTQIQQACQFAGLSALGNVVPNPAVIVAAPRVRETGTHTVRVCAYDLSKGFVKSQNWSPASGLSVLDGVWHLSVLAFNTEYQMADKVTKTEFDLDVNTLIRHRQSAFAKQHDTKYHLFESYEFALPRVSKDVFERYLDALSGDRFHGGTYDLINNNCVDFVRDILWFLVRDRVHSKFANQVRVISESKDSGVQFCFQAVKFGFNAVVQNEIKNSEGAMVASKLGGMAWSYVQGLTSFMYTMSNGASKADVDRVMINPAVDGRSEVERRDSALRPSNDAMEYDLASSVVVPFMPMPVPSAPPADETNDPMESDSKQASTMGAYAWRDPPVRYIWRDDEPGQVNLTMTQLNIQ